MKLNPATAVLVCLAAAGAALLAGGQSTPSYEDQVIGIAVHQSFGGAASQIAAEKPEVQALLLDYADNEPLVLKARLALMRYPDLARRILLAYGEQPNFQEILLKYGEAALPPIAYFMDNNLTTLKMRRAFHARLEEVKRLYAQLAGTPVDDAVSVSEPNAEARGGYAILFIQEDGYDFLGQFSVASDGKPVWVQTERLMEGISDFFLGGVSGLERKWRQGVPIEAPDLGWAALDVLVIASTVKLLRAVRTARAATPGAAAARSSRFSERVFRFGSRVLASGGRLGLAAARYGTIPAAVYLMFRYPQLINSTLAVLGDWMGVDPWLVQFLFWFVGLSVIMHLAMFLLAPLSRLLRGLGWMSGSLAAWYRSSARAPTARSAPVI